MTSKQILEDYETFNNASYDEYLRIKRAFEDLCDYENIGTIKTFKEQSSIISSIRELIKEDNKYLDESKKIYIESQSKDIASCIQLLNNSLNRNDKILNLLPKESNTNDDKELY